MIELQKHENDAIAFANNLYHLQYSDDTPCPRREAGGRGGGRRGGRRALGGAGRRARLGRLQRLARLRAAPARPPRPAPRPARQEAHR